MRRIVPLLLSACLAEGGGPPADTDAPPAMGRADGVIRFRGGAGRLDELEALVEARASER